jgi:hypothetical protein
MTSVTVVVPMTIRRRGGRKRIIGPDGEPVAVGSAGAGAATTRGDPALVKSLARAFRWRRMLEEGRYGSIRELAAAEQIERTFAARALGMTLLAPDIVEAILDGREPLAPPLRPSAAASRTPGRPSAWRWPAPAPQRMSATRLQGANDRTAMTGHSHGPSTRSCGRPGPPGALFEPAA